jgi:hypothetical protein
VPGGNDESDHILAEVLDWFGQIEEWIPGGWGGWLLHAIIGESPLAKATDVYELAEEWGNLAELLGNAYEEANQAIQPVLENWSGDGAAADFARNWYDYAEGLRSVTDGAGQMQGGVQSFGLEIELMKFMVVVNLIGLAFTIYALIMALIPTGGGSAGLAPPAFFGFRTLLSKIAANTVGKIAAIVARVTINPLLKVASRFVAPAVTKAIEKVAETAAVKALNRAAQAVARNAAAKLAADNALMKGVRNLMARGIAKSVAHRLAAQQARGPERNSGANWPVRPARPSSANSPRRSAIS